MADSPESVLLGQLRAAGIHDAVIEESEGASPRVRVDISEQLRLAEARDGETAAMADAIEAAAMGNLGRCGPPPAGAARRTTTRMWRRWKRRWRPARRRRLRPARQLQPPAAAAAAAAAAGARPQRANAGIKQGGRPSEAQTQDAEMASAGAEVDADEKGAEGAQQRAAQHRVAAILARHRSFGVLRRRQAAAAAAGPRAAVPSEDRPSEDAAAAAWRCRCDGAGIWRGRRRDRGAAKRAATAAAALSGRKRKRRRASPQLPPPDHRITRRP